MRPLHFTLVAAALVLCLSCQKDETKAGTDSDTKGDEVAAAGTPPAVAEIGKLAPELTVTNAHNWDGGPVALADLRGKVVVLDFWTYW